MLFLAAKFKLAVRHVWIRKRGPKAKKLAATLSSSTGGCFIYSQPKLFFAGTSTIHCHPGKEPKWHPPAELGSDANAGIAKRNATRRPNPSGHCVIRQNNSHLFRASEITALRFVQSLHMGTQKQGPHAWMALKKGTEAEHAYLHGFDNDSAHMRKEGFGSCEKM